MRVKFDSLNRYEVPGFVLCNPGSVYRDGSLTRVIGPIVQTSDEEVEFNFNSTSTLSFRSTKVRRDGSPEKEYASGIYSSLQNRRLIFVEDIGYFIITDVDEGYENGISYKDVTASSCEIEIQNKSLMYIEDGTYLFLDLFEDIVSTLPKWTIYYIDSVVADRYRTFEDVDTTLNTFAFMMEEMQEAYECIFTFDTINRTISVYDKNNYIVRTDIHLTQRDLINTFNAVENSDELYTALSVFGDNEVTISSVNPLGTTTIYNFDCYLDWMSDSLREKVIRWSNLVESYCEPYYDMNVSYYDTLTEHSNCSAEIDKLTSQLELYRRLRDNVVAESSGDKVQDFNEAIQTNGGKPVDISDSVQEILQSIDRLILNTDGSINSKKELLNGLQQKMDDAKNSMMKIHNEVSISNFFTQEEYDELYDYIYEGIYTDDYITTTDIMTNTEKLEQMRELYNRSKKSLKLASFPSQEFSVDVEDFVFSKSFQRWSEQLETGSLINVELDNGEMAELFLITILLNWEDKTLSLTFGNRFNRFDPQALFNNVLGDVQRSSNTINYIKEIIYPVKGGKLDQLEGEIQNTRILAINDVLTSHNGEILIDGTGYTGKKKSSESGYEKEQFKLTSNSIVLTDDAWNTRRTILGNIPTPKGDLEYGLNAGVLAGQMTIGDYLKVCDSNGNDMFEYFEDTISSLEEDCARHFSDISEEFLSLNSTIGNVASGTNIVQMIEDSMYDDSALSQRVSANTAAIAGLEEMIKELHNL